MVYTPFHGLIMGTIDSGLITVPTVASALSVDRDIVAIGIHHLEQKGFLACLCRAVGAFAVVPKQISSADCPVRTTQMQRSTKGVKRNRTLGTIWQSQRRGPRSGKMFRRRRTRKHR